MKDRLVLSIWVEAPQELRLQRGLERDGEGMRQAWEKWQVMEKAFFQWDGARERAKLEVDGTKGTTEGFWTLRGAL
jgi:uridine kinase